MASPIKTCTPLAACIIFAGCIPDRVYQAELDRLERATENLEEVRAAGVEDNQKRRESITAASVELATVVAAARRTEASIVESRLEQEALEKEFATYRQDFRNHLRETVADMVFAEVQIDGGAVLKNFRIKSIGSGTIRYSSSQSSGSIPFAEIPAVLADALKLEEEREDRAKFPEIVPARVSDTDAGVEADARLSAAFELAGGDISKLDRPTKERVRKTLREHENGLLAKVRGMSAERALLVEKRREHRQYDLSHVGKARAPAIEALTRSIERIDAGSKATYKKITETRALISDVR